MTSSQRQVLDQPTKRKTQHPTGVFAQYLKTFGFADMRRNERQQIARNLHKKLPMPNIYEHLPTFEDLPSFAVDNVCDGTHVDKSEKHGKVQQEVVGLAEDDLADVAQLFLALMVSQSYLEPLDSQR